MTAQEQTVEPEAPAKPKYMVAGDTFFVQTDQGELQIPLKVKTKLFRKLRDEHDEALDQLITLLDGIGDTTTAAALDELDITETMSLAQEFFARFNERLQASLGESSRSSTS